MQDRNLVIVSYNLHMLGSLEERGWMVYVGIFLALHLFRGEILL